MSAFKILTHYLTRAAVITDRVTKEGIYPIELPQRALPPCYLMNMAGGSDTQLLGGAGGYYLGRVSIESLSLEPGEAMDMGDALLEVLQDVVKDVIPVSKILPRGFKDVDIWYADTDVTDTSDDRSMKRRILHFYVRWRYLQPAT